jgi:3-methyladenine DNA glycosylase AlkD
MTKNEVFALLEVNRNERGIKNWKKMGLGTSGLTSYGIGLTQLRKLARQVGRDHDLAFKLWNSDNYDAKTISMLIDEPKKITREQAEQQVEQLDVGLLVHVYASCDATLAKVDFVVELAQQWMDSDDNVRRRCGYKLLYELSKDKRKKELDDPFFLGYINRIRLTIHDQGFRVAQCMQGALLGIGKRNKDLNTATIEALKAIGPVATNPDDHCEPTDVLKHLSSGPLVRCGA